LKRLLHYGPAAESAGAEKPGGKSGDHEIIVVPRPGTISPWSSKATDIARNCGLDAIRRIERGIVYQVSGAAAAASAEIAGQLHDRMTQAVLPSIDAASVLFASAEPAPLQSVDILGNGKEALEVAN